MQTPLVLIRRAGRLFGARVKEVAGAGRLEAITAVPGAPPWMWGATIHQGAVLSLIDLVPFLGLSQTGVADLPVYLVLMSNGSRIGLLVEELLGLEETDGEVGPNEGSEHPGIAGIARRGGEPIYVLSASVLFGDSRLKP